MQGFKGSGCEYFILIIARATRGSWRMNSSRENELNLDARAIQFFNMTSLFINSWYEQTQKECNYNVIVKILDVCRMYTSN